MKPFRWSIEKREQLGTLVSNTRPLGWYQQGFLSAVREASARVAAFAGSADMAFLGRTPENFFDYLSGVFSGIADAPKLHLVQFSLRWSGTGGVRSIEPEKLNTFFEYLASEGVDAGSISRSSSPLALVDFIAHGGTMQNFIALLHLQAERDGVDWNAVQRRLKIIGLRVRTHNSPNTWRWQQHQDWLHLIPDAIIKNVSAPAHLVFHLANDQPKVTHAFHPGRWRTDDGEDRAVSDEQRQALSLAVRLYETGRQREERHRFARLLASSPEMRQPATRRLVSRIRRR